MAPRGTTARLRANIAAIELLQRLENEDRNPLPEEKQILAQYVGWGGLSQVFDEDKAGDYAREEHLTLRREAQHARSESLRVYYQKEAQALENWYVKWGIWNSKLKGLLTLEEYDAAAASTINAHYTSREIIGAMWKAVERLGFQGGNVLEPAGGVGHFLGLMPETIADTSRTSAVELDSVSGRIMRKLYPEADVQVAGFQEARIPDNSIDLAISNVPFANINVFDPTMGAVKAPKLSLHNYFFAKALQKVKPGGLVAFITTSNTLDANIAQRKWLAQRGELIAAMRLPNTAFHENAGTEVTTDILFIRKPDGTPSPFPAQDFALMSEAQTRRGEPISINEYFVRHPEMVLGQLDNDGRLHGGVRDDKKQMTVHPHPDIPLSQSLDAAIERLPQNVITSGRFQPLQESVPVAAGMKVGTLVQADDGRVLIAGTDAKDEDILQPHNRRLAARFIQLRDTLNELYRLELNPASSNEAIETQRAELNQRYDTFVYHHGHLHKHNDLLGIDPDFYRLLGTEVEKKPEAGAESVKSAISRKKIWIKGAVYTQRVLTPRVEPTHADMLSDALGISLGWRGRLDTDFMAFLLNQEPEKVASELLREELAFRDPESGILETREEYLSGNVRHKLRVAEAMAHEEPVYAVNVEELRRVQPAEVKIEDIRLKLGSAWIPESVITQFGQEILDSDVVKVTYRPSIGNILGDSWNVRYGSQGAGTSSGLTVAMEQTYGTSRMSGLELLEKALNMQQPEIYDPHPTEKKIRVFNPVATTQAQVAMQKIKDEFDSWVRRKPDVQDVLVKTYNEVNNSHVLRKYNGQFLQFPWLAKGFDLYSDKKDVVWRAIQDGRMLIAHGVGGGKTLIGTAIAMEMKRLGHTRKPLIAVHNATLEQFAGTINAMAPTARVLVARKNELEGPKRKEFMARAAAGDWDAIVMAHSSFDMIPDDPEYERKVLNGLKDELREAIDKADGDGLTVKELQKQLLRLEESMAKLQSRAVDDVLTFQEMGVDAIIFDEVHLYKKLPFVSKLHRVAGIDNGNSKRGTALMTKARYLQERNKNRNVITMTGTPVTNTLGESWNMVRLVAPDLLREFRVECFDSFVSTFAEIVPSAELRANGAYKQVNRLAALSNLPEWNNFFRLAADVKMGEDMQVKNRPEIKGGKPELIAVERTPQVAKFTEFIKKVIDDYERMSGRERKEHSYIPMVTYGMAKMAAIDIRLVDPDARDEPGSKVNHALQKVMELYHRTSEYKGTQVIFSDNFRPFKGSVINTKEAMLEPSSNDDASDEREALQAGGFNLYQDIKSKLIAFGVPAEEIAIITDYATDPKKNRLFDQLNEGKVRIVIGSTKKLGTGVNMQQRMIAAHHLDVPWTPAELEQRDGRVYRQGNIHAEIGVPVEIYRYGMKDTLDAALWQKLETKERFIKQAISGKINARSIEDDTGLLNFAEQKAVLSGALGMRKFEADQRLRELRAEERAWRKSMADASNTVRWATSDIQSGENSLVKMQEVSQIVTGWNEQVVFQMNGITATSAKDAIALLKEVFDERLKLICSFSNPLVNPRATAPIGKATFNGAEIELGQPAINERITETKLALRWRMEVPITFNGMAVGTANAPGWVLNKLQEFPLLLQGRIEHTRRSIERSHAEIKAANAEMTKPFPKAAALEAALHEHAEVMSLLSQESRVTQEPEIQPEPVQEVVAPPAKRRVRVRRSLDQELDETSGTSQRPAAAVAAPVAQKPKVRIR